MGEGGLAYFDVGSSSTLSTDNTHAHGTLQGWYVTGRPRSATRLELRINGGVDYYDATTISAPAANTLQQFNDFDALVIRATANVGVRVRVEDAFYLRLRGGGGGQYATYDTTSVGSGGVFFNSPDTMSERGEAHLDFRFRGIGSRNGVSAAREGVRRLHIAQVRAKMPFVHRHWTGGPR